MSPDFFSQNPDTPDETIVAVATPEGEGAIGILRISGNKTELIIKAVFKHNNHNEALSPRKATLGELRHPETGEPLDQILVTLFRAPASYSGEDMAELYTHGGPLVVRGALKAVLATGLCRPAQPGEFTRRAVMNGKMDLTQAEAVLDMVRARTEGARRNALDRLRGAAGKPLGEAWESMAAVAARLEVIFDYPGEEATDEPPREEVVDALRPALAALRDAARRYADGDVLNAATHVAIVGRPNVGKSSLLNRLVGHDRAIVSSTPGTTRDAVAEWVREEGLDIRLVDTAGFADNPEGIEREGVERARDIMMKADALICVFDGAAPPAPADHAFLDSLPDGPKKLCVLNKRDLPTVFPEDALGQKFETVVRVSARTGENAAEVRDWMRAVAMDIASVSENVLITSRRQKALVDAAIAALEDAVEKDWIPLDVIAVDIRSAMNAVGDILGRNPTDEVLNAVFENFCIGK